MKPSNLSCFKQPGRLFGLCEGFNRQFLDTQDPNLMRSHLKIFLKSFKNLLTINAEEMELKEI
jgi:hypothetical protein